MRSGISRQTVNDARNDYLKIKNVSKFLQRKKRQTPPIQPKITGKVQARIISIGLQRSAARLRPVGFKVISGKECRASVYQFNLKHEHIQRFKKTKLKPHLKKYWCIPPKQNSAFVAAMEDI